MSLHHGLRATAGASPADPYFSSTSLLLLGNGTNGGQNNTFVDSSTNNFTITRNGNTTQGSFGPFGYNWSNYFDGDGDYLSVSDNASLRMGTGNFTIEFWIYFTSISGYQTPLTKGYNVTGSLTFQTGNGDGKIVVYTGSPGTALMTVSTAATVNAWNHYALVRSGTTLTLYLNGSSVGTATNSTDFNSTGDLGIGSNLASLFYPITGYISNLRILKGTALYTSAFTPPTAPLTAITNTSLLTCQSNRFLDNSSNAFAITPYGNASVSNFAPFPTNSEYSTGTNGGSGYFDGSNYLTFPSITFNGDFCAECWYYRTANPASYSVLFGGPSVGIPGNHQFSVGNDGSITMVLAQSVVISNAGTAATLNAWNHIAWVRSGSNCAVFVNGVRQGTGVSANNASTCDRIGDISNLSGYRPIGYVSNSRIVIGSSVYNPTASTLTVPTAPLTAITNTSLLLNFTNASILDSTGKNDLETVGDAQISTSVKKFGTGSLKFDGTGDYLAAAPNAAFQFGTGDFTVECWINKPSAANGSVVDARSGGTGATPWAFYVDGSNYPYFYDGTTYTSTVAITNNDWNHIAVVRTSGVLKIFVNGTQGYSASHSVSLNATGSLLIGGTAAYANGYIDDLRITKGVARYTAAFTPPSRQLPAR